MRDIGRTSRTIGLLAALLAGALAAAAPARADAALEAAIAALQPQLEAYVGKGMADFHDPGLAIGIVTGDKLVYAKGFGVTETGGATAVTPTTVFQIGSTTKAFLAATLAIAVDKGKLAWDDRVVDRMPAFQLRDPWVTREFRLFDLLAQRSGMPSYANDSLGVLGFDRDWLIASLRNVEPVSSFRSTFAYTNITHLVAQEIVAGAMGAESWDALVAAEIFAPLGMAASSTSAAAIEAAPAHSSGHLWAPEGVTVVPFTQVFPYDYGGAGAVNSTVEDLSRWVRMQLGMGEFEGARIVSEANLAQTRLPRVGLSDRVSYAMGWVWQATPNGRILWHNGGTPSHGAFVGLVPDRDLAVIVLTNETNVGFPDAVGEWTIDRLLGNPEVDHVAAKLAQATAAAKAGAAAFAEPADPEPSPEAAALAGDYANPSFGAITLEAGENGLVGALAETGDSFAFAPWSGAVFTLSLVADDRNAAMAANIGPGPLGFVQFTAGGDGKLAGFRFFDKENGQVFDFARK